MKTVVKVQGNVEALVIIQLLSSHDIEVFPSSHADHTVHPFTLDGLGEIRIQVKDEDEEEARQIIDAFLKSGTDGEDYGLGDER